MLYSDYYRAKEEAAERRFTHYVGNIAVSLKHFGCFDDDDFMYDWCDCYHGACYDAAEENHVSDER